MSHDIPATIRQILAHHEGQRIDFKEEVSDDLFKHITAFANSDGGVIVLGVEDGTRDIVGIDLRNNTLKKLSDRIVTNLGIHPVIEQHPVNNTHIVTITVSKSSVPVSYKMRYYTRVGDTTREMNHDELRTFFQQSIEWDAIPGNYTVDEIDRVTLRKFLKLAENAGRLYTGKDDEKIETVLQRLGLIINGKITNGAIMLFGKDPQKYFHNTNTRVGRFKTADVIIGNKEISGNLFNQLDDAENAIKIYINVRWSITEEGMRDTLQRREKWEYPIVAIREALLNALIHRDYFNNTVQTQIKIFDGFIRFHNPGKLPEGVTVDMLLKEHYGSSLFHVGKLNSSWPSLR